MAFCMKRLDRSRFSVEVACRRDGREFTRDASQHSRLCSLPSTGVSTFLVIYPAIAMNEKSSVILALGLIISALIIAHSLNKVAIAMPNTSSVRVQGGLDVKVEGGNGYYPLKVQQVSK